MKHQPLLRQWYWLALVVVTAHAVGCAVKPGDYRAFLDHQPSSILVLPPLNMTTEVRAADAFLSTVTSPLAESGYYVFPMALVDQMLKENGMPTPGEMHQVPIKKLGEVFGADAVLYIVIKEWKTQYIVVSSSTEVLLEYRLVDVDTGVEMWRFEQRVRQGKGGISYAALIEAALDAVVSAATDRARDLAVIANHQAFFDSHRGVLKGRRHPGFEEDQQHRRTQQQQFELEAANGG